MTIAAILNEKGKDVTTITVDTTAADAVAVLAQRRIGALPVLDGNDVAGIFSERDLIYCLAADGADALARPVRELMTAPAVTAASDHKVLDALSLMT